MDRINDVLEYAMDQELKDDVLGFIKDYQIKHKINGVVTEFLAVVEGVVITNKTFYQVIDHLIEEAKRFNHEEIITHETVSLFHNMINHMNRDSEYAIPLYDFEAATTGFVSCIDDKELSFYIEQTIGFDYELDFISKVAEILGFDEYL